MIFAVSFLYAFLVTPLPQQFTYSIKFFMADNCFMVPTDHDLVFFSVVTMPFEMVIRICFLQDDITGIFFVR